MSLQSRLSTLITALGADEKRHHGVVIAASTATLTPVATAKNFILTAQAAALTVAAPTGSPLDGQEMLFRFKDNGTARGITWNAIFRAVGVTLPITTVINKTLYVGAKYNSADTKWDVIAVGQEA